MSALRSLRFSGSPSLLAAVSAALISSTNVASALEYRKCSMDIVITGVGVPATPIPGSQVTGWARSDSGSDSARAINQLARSCLEHAVGGNHSTLPQGCETNVNVLNNSDRKGRGLTGFSLTNGYDALKRTICESNFGRNFNRTNADQTYDKRRIEGFRVSFRKTGGNAACRGQQFYPTQTMEIFCKAHRDMLRFEKPIRRMYRPASGYPVPSMCRTPITARAGGDTIPSARLAANREWQSAVVRQFGSGLEDHRKRKGMDMKCAKRLSGETKVVCTLTATPCFF